MFRAVTQLVTPFVLLAACAVTQADIVARGALASPAQMYATSPAALPEPVATDAETSLADLNWLFQARAPGPAAVSVPRSAADCAGQAAAQELPPSPSSLALSLSAFAGLGLFQAGRSVRKLHFGTLPDWYHTGAVQVGHVTPFDLEFGDLPACMFDQPVARPAFAHRIPRENRPRLRSESFLLIVFPRGPPSLS